MANATISVSSETQTGNFNVMVTFDVAVTDFAAATLAVTAVSGNGITDVVWAVLPDDDMDSSTYSVWFELPSNVEGALQIAISGMVTRQGGSSPETVMANALIVSYDTTENIAATFGTVEYRDGGIVVLPITFAENLIAPSKTVFQFNDADSNAGDGVSGIESYYLVGEDDEYELVIQIAEDRSGRFVVSTDGYVLKASSKVWDNVVTNQALADRTFAYSTAKPDLIDYEIPANYNFGEKFYVLVEFATVVTGWHLNNTVTQIFIEEGARIGTPTPYKWIGANPPDIHAPVSGELSTDKRFIGTDWERLSAPPEGTPTPGMNGFSDDGKEWHGEEAQYFLISYEVSATARGVFNLSLRQPSILRGPTGA